MKIHFGQLSIHCFKSIFKLDFNLHRESGVHFISGMNKVEPRLESNGAGKSSIFDALTWCLYGKTVDGERNPDIVPWGESATPAVVLQMQLDDKFLVVGRTTNPNRLTLNGKESDQKTLERKLGLSFATFTHTILLGQEMPLFFDLTPSQKMKLFSDVLDLERWERRSTNANRVANEMEIKLSEEQGAILGLGRQLKDAEQMLAEAKEKSEQWEAELASRLEEAQKTMKQLRQQMKVVQERHDEADLKLDGASIELHPIKRELEQLHEYRNSNTGEQIRLESKIRVMQREHERLTNELQQLTDGRCPTCGQRVKHVGNRDVMRTKIKEVFKQCNPGPLEALKKIDVDLTSQIVTLEEKEIQLTKTVDDCRLTLDGTRPQLAEMKAKLTLLVDAQRTNEEQANPLHDQVVSLRRTVGKIKTEIDNRTKKHNMKARKALRTKFWAQGFKDLQLQIIEEVLQELELCSNVMLDQLGLVGWSLRYAIEKELKGGGTQRGLNVFVCSPHYPQPVRWESWSGGERQRLRLLGALALSEVLLNRADLDPNLEILDEPTAHLTPRGVSDLINFLHERAQQLQRIILLVDQNAVASGRFTSTMTVIRSRKGTSLQVA